MSGNSSNQVGSRPLDSGCPPPPPPPPPLSQPLPRAQPATPPPFYRGRSFSAIFAVAGVVGAIGLAITFAVAQRYAKGSPFLELKPWIWVTATVGPAALTMVIGLCILCPRQPTAIQGSWQRSRHEWRDSAQQHNRAPFGVHVDAIGRLMHTSTQEALNRLQVVAPPPSQNPQFPAVFKLHEIVNYSRELFGPQVSRWVAAPVLIDGHKPEAYRLLFFDHEKSILHVIHEQSTDSFLHQQAPYSLSLRYLCHMAHTLGLSLASTICEPSHFN